MFICVPKMDEFEQILDRKLTPFLVKFEQLSDKVEDALSSLSFLSDKYEEIKGKVFLLQESNKSLKMENSFLSNELAKATNEMESLRDLQDEFELEVRGIPQLQGENTNEIIMKIGSKVGVIIKQEHISKSSTARSRK